VANLIPEVVARRTEIEVLCRRLGVKRLEVFGSAATGAFHSEDSDLDFLVEFERTELGSQYADRYFELIESLEELFSRPVDLVIASAIRNPYFLESVERTKALLYAA
jgi:predicted nucleotidyltransferase